MSGAAPFHTYDRAPGSQKEGSCKIMNAGRLVGYTATDCDGPPDASQRAQNPCAYAPQPQDCLGEKVCDIQSMQYICHGMYSQKEH